MIVGRVEPQHANEHAFGLYEPTQTPAAQAVPVHAAEKRPVVNVPPREKPLEALAQ